MSISSASVYGVPQTTSWRDIAGQISSLADIFRRERQRNEELFLHEAYRQITTAYNGDAFAWAQNEPESYKKFAKLLGLPETPGKVTPQGWLALGKIATAEALRQGKEPFEYSIQEEPIPVPQPQPAPPPAPTPPQGPEITLVSTPGGAQGTPAPVPPPQLGPVTIDPKALYALGLQLGTVEGAEILKAYQRENRTPGLNASGAAEAPQAVYGEPLARRVLSNLVDQYAQEGKALNLGSEHYEALLRGIRDALAKQGLPVELEPTKPQGPGGVYREAGNEALRRMQDERKAAENARRRAEIEEALNQAKETISRYPTDVSEYANREEILSELSPRPSDVRTKTGPKLPELPEKSILKPDQSAVFVAKRLFQGLPRDKVYTMDDVKKIVEENKKELDTAYRAFNTAGLTREDFQKHVWSALVEELAMRNRLDMRDRKFFESGEKSSAPAKKPEEKPSRWGPPAPAPTPTTPQPTTPAATSTTSPAPTTPPTPTKSETNVLLDQVNNLAGKVTKGEGVKKEEVNQVAQTIEKAVSPPPPEVQKQVKRVVVAKLKPEFQGNMYLRLIESQYQDPDSPVRKTFEGLYAGEVKSMEELKRLQLENRQLETTVKALYEDPEMVELLKQKIRAEVRELMASGELKLAQARNLEHVLTNEILKTAVSLYASEMLGTMAQQQGNTELLKVLNELTNSLKIVHKDLGDKELTAQFATALSQLLARATGEQRFLQFSTKPGWLGLWTAIVSNLAQFPPQPPVLERTPPSEAYLKGARRIINPEFLEGFRLQGRQNDTQRLILEEIMRMLNQNNQLK